MAIILSLVCFKEENEEIYSNRIATVISILGILESILLPSISKAREKGISAACKSNLKQQNLVLLLYIDNEEVFPSLTIPNPNNGSPLHWAKNNVLN